MDFVKAPNRREQLGDESYGTPQRSILGQRNSEVNYYEAAAAHHQRGRDSIARGLSQPSKFPGNITDFSHHKPPPHPKQLPTPPALPKEVDYSSLPVP